MYFPISTKEKTKMSANNKCPVTGCGFCWKNPIHAVLFLAILPFALKGLVVAWETVQAAVTTLTK
jgi:hypothetical protein